MTNANRMPLEVCVDTIDGAWTAAQNGADRIELCASLALGGLTPSPGTMRAAAEISVPVYAMIRPRAGDFVYSERDKSVMEADVRAAEAAGLAGIVTGACVADGELDAAFLARLIGATRLRPTLHRAFDTLTDIDRAVDQAVALGFERILTSGGAPAAELGLAAIRQTVERAAGRIAVMIGSGVTAANVDMLLDRTGADELHASCASLQPVSPAHSGVRLGFVPESGMRCTDPLLVRSLRQAIDRRVSSQNGCRAMGK